MKKVKTILLGGTMKKLIELLTYELEAAFEKAGYDKQYARVTLSNRPDLCEYQCNGAMAGAKQYKKAPLVIANDVAERLKDSNIFSEVSVIAPGFLNLKISNAFLINNHINTSVFIINQI